MLTPDERSLRARTAAHRLHATYDPKQTTANGRAKFLRRFEEEVDLEGILSPEERRRRAEHARNAHFSSLDLKSARARRRRKEAAQPGGCRGGPQKVRGPEPGQSAGAKGKGDEA